MNETIAVTGGGVMGAQIAQVFAMNGHTVRLHDITTAQLDAARQRIMGGRFGTAAAVRRGKLTADEEAAALGRIAYTTDLAEACDGADLVQEAVPEEIGLKVRVFRAIDRVAPEHAVLVSNTAGLPVTALAHATDRPTSVLGWHWFQPCVAMRCAELVVHPQVDPDVLERVRTIARGCGKNVVVVNDESTAPGFVANRISFAIRREADRIVAEGVASPEDVDAIMRDAFRWPMGPFELRSGATLG